MKRKISTEFAYVAGLLLIACGVSLMERADYGVSMVVAPAYLLYRWLSPMWSFVTFGMAEYCLQSFLRDVRLVLLGEMKSAAKFGACQTCQKHFTFRQTVSSVR